MERKIKIDKEFYVKLSGEVTTSQSDEEISEIIGTLDRDLEELIRKEIAEDANVSVYPFKRKGIIYTKMTKKALQICFSAHKDQFDKGNIPYVFHPYHLAEQMTSEKAVIVALLHDVVEDTSVTLNDLRGHGFPEDVVEAVKLLTHSKPKLNDSEYEEYIKAISKNPIAKEVKLADLIHNSDLSRLPVQKCTDEKAISRTKRYKKAIEMLLDGANNEHEINMPGRWILEREPNGKPYCIHCSICDSDFHNISHKTATKFCPDCGHRMIDWRIFDADS